MKMKFISLGLSAFILLNGVEEIHFILRWLDNRVHRDGDRERIKIYNKKDTTTSNTLILRLYIKSIKKSKFEKHAIRN